MLEWIGLTRDNSTYTSLVKVASLQDALSTYLGTVTPAFSQAWMSADPAVAVVSSCYAVQQL
jgi:hypothetical protein